MEKHCASCGMPLKNQEDIALETKQGPLCKFCVDSKGKPKSCEEVFKDGIDFFMNSVGVDKNLAEKGLLSLKRLLNLFYF